MPTEYKVKLDTGERLTHDNWASLIRVVALKDTSDSKKLIDYLLSFRDEVNAISQ